MTAAPLRRSSRRTPLVQMMTTSRFRPVQPAPTVGAKEKGPAPVVEDTPDEESEHEDSEVADDEDDGASSEESHPGASLGLGTEYRYSTTYLDLLRKYDRYRHGVEEDGKIESKNTLSRAAAQRELHRRPAERPIIGAVSLKTISSPQYNIVSYFLYILPLLG